MKGSNNLILKKSDSTTDISNFESTSERLGMIFSLSPHSVLTERLMETQKMMAILSLFLVATISTLCESYRPSPNHFTSCSNRDKVTFTLDKTFISDRQQSKVQTLYRDVTVVVSLLCAPRQVTQHRKTTSDVSGRIMQGKV